MSIGENIRNLRLNKGLTQSELGEEINVHQSMIAQIERGTKIPTILLSREIAKILNCTIDDLLKE